MKNGSKTEYESSKALRRTEMTENKPFANPSKVMVQEIGGSTNDRIVKRENPGNHLKLCDLI